MMCYTSVVRYFLTTLLSLLLLSLLTLACEAKTIV